MKRQRVTISKERKIEAFPQVSNFWTPLYNKAWHLRKSGDKLYKLANKCTDLSKTSLDSEKQSQINPIALM